MSSAVQLGSTQLLPVKEAAEFVPYSRDYVARLAREGKVVAVQIDRQWFVDVTSLQNFYANATIEESVRKRKLSSSRKRDLEVKEFYRTRLEAIAKKRHTNKQHAVVHTGLILLCGLGAGVLFTTASHYSDYAHLQMLAQLPRLVFEKTVVEKLPLATPQVTTVLDVADQAMSYGIEVTDQSLDFRQGIVVLPQTGSSTSTVADFFSDPVTVETTSDTSGTVRNTVSDQTLPFVRVPAGADVMSSASSNVTAP